MIVALRVVIRGDVRRLAEKRIIASSILRSRNAFSAKEKRHISSTSTIGKRGEIVMAVPMGRDFWKFFALGVGTIGVGYLGYANYS